MRALSESAFPSSGLVLGDVPPRKSPSGYRCSVIPGFRFFPSSGLTRGVTSPRLHPRAYILRSCARSFRERVPRTCIASPSGFRYPAYLRLFRPNYIWTFLVSCARSFGERVPCASGLTRGLFPRASIRMAPIGIPLFRLSSSITSKLYLDIFLSCARSFRERVPRTCIALLRDSGVPLFRYSGYFALFCIFLTFLCPKICISQNFFVSLHSISNLPANYRKARSSKSTQLANTPLNHHRTPQKARLTLK